MIEDIFGTKEEVSVDKYIESLGIDKSIDSPKNKKSGEILRSKKDLEEFPVTIQGEFYHD